MHYPKMHLEKKLKRNGFLYVAGVDEAGRGAWAGPIVAAAIILDTKKRIKGVADSKLLRPPQRSELYELLVNEALCWSTGVVSEKIIDEIGISKANHLAMDIALKNLGLNPDYVLIDALKLENLPMPCLSVIKGDYKIYSIAAASIIAKVTRDKIMDGYADDYAYYGFRHHKGYGTNFHYQMICQYGICDIHRKTFEPMKYFLNA